MKASKRLFGEVEGRPVYEYTLENSQGMQVSVMDYGATLTAIKTPDKDGKIANITLGFDSVEPYVTYRPYYGATIGRVAGRIANGAFELDGKPVQLTINEGVNHHHGGSPAFDSRFWEVQVKAESDSDESSFIFTYLSPDDENGYPGNLTVQVKYLLTQANECKIQYTATTDKTTLFNPTNHVYFNLSGNHANGILEHKLQLNSDFYAPLESDSVPTGQLIDVTDSPFDFRQAMPLKTGVESAHPQIVSNRGYDHPFMLNPVKTGEANGQLTDATSKRRVRFYTDREAVVVYLNNWAEELYEIDGQTVRPYSGVALETQVLPDAIHHDNFGNVILKPGEKFYSETIYQFDLI
ncbi:aldose epimerase family protein [Carnobacterium sp. TMP28]|uniref:aldose epimerase family protein n=1 Tax=Carnobacterium sp. TMP28 TaxID=3397060 RepID=UPI0039E138F7